MMHMIAQNGKAINRTISIRNARVTASSGGALTRPGLDVLERPKARPKVTRPPMYRVVMLNDDYTPMDFVVQILQDIFHKPPEEAVTIMRQIHEKGSGLCGVYTREVAETKVETVIAHARRHEHPLQCVMEKER